MLWGGIFDYDNRLKIIKEYESNTTNPNFWDDKKNAEVVLKKINQNKIWTDSYLEIQNMYDDLVILNDFYISGEADKQEIEKESNKLNILLSASLISAKNKCLSSGFLYPKLRASLIDCLNIKSEFWDKGIWVEE